VQRLRLEPTRREVGVDGDVVVCISVGTERKKASKSETKKKSSNWRWTAACGLRRSKTVTRPRTSNSLGPLKCPPRRLNLITRFLFTFLWKSTIGKLLPQMANFCPKHENRNPFLFYMGLPSTG
jgi:hypothetical protein